MNRHHQDLNRLQQEPRQLRCDAEAADSDILQLFLENYTVSLENHSCARHARRQSDRILAASNAIVTHLPSLRKDFNDFHEVASRIAEAHRRNRQTLDQHLRLQEILEIPALMDTCTRTNRHKEALDIVAFANTLDWRHKLTLTGTGNSQNQSADCEHKNKNRIIRAIVAAVRKSALILRGQLLQKLSTSLQLPTCIDIVSCLQRLDGLELERDQRVWHSQLGKEATDRMTEIRQAELEQRLQIDFLRGRDAWLQGILDTAASAMQAERARASSAADNSDEITASTAMCSYLVEIIEKNRTHWFDIATQFQAIFGNMGDGGGNDSRSSTVLAAWLCGRTEWFLRHLRELLHTIAEGNAFHDLLEQSMFFAASMGRIGADFRPLLVPIFEQSITSFIVMQWDDAVAAFENSLNGESGDGSNRDGSAHKCPAPLRVSSILSQTNTADNGASGSAEAAERDAVYPPDAALAFPLLAHHCNMFILSFNHLRQCAPCSLQRSLAESLKRCLFATCDSLAKVEARTSARCPQMGAQEESLDADGRVERKLVVLGGDDPVAEQKALALLSACFADEVLPFLCGCFDSVFAQQSGENPLGRAVQKSVLSRIRAEGDAQLASTERDGGSLEAK